jgi:hypothetical protein
MDQRSIVLYFARKGLNAMVIHRELRATLWSEVVNYPSVTAYLREAKFSLPIPLPTFSESDLQADNSDTAILLALDEQPFVSVRQLARLTHLPRTTVHRRLTESLEFRVRHLRWMPHILLDSQKVARVTLSRELLRVLNQQRVRSWHDIVTLDESWLYLNMYHEFIWLQPDVEVPERERHTVQSKKSYTNYRLESCWFSLGRFSFPANQI